MCQFVPKILQTFYINISYTRLVFMKSINFLHCLTQKNLFVFLNNRSSANSEFAAIVCFFALSGPVSIISASVALVVFFKAANDSSNNVMTFQYMSHFMYLIADYKFSCMSTFSSDWTWFPLNLFLNMLSTSLPFLPHLELYHSGFSHFRTICRSYKSWVMKASLHLYAPLL